MKNIMKISFKIKVYIQLKYMCINGILFELKYILRMRGSIQYALHRNSIKVL